MFDGGTLGDTEECRKGSTVVNLAAPGTYKIIRDGRFVKSCEVFHKQERDFDDYLNIISSSALLKTTKTLHQFGLKESFS